MSIVKSYKDGIVGMQPVETGHRDKAERPRAVRVELEQSEGIARVLDHTDERTHRLPAVENRSDQRRNIELVPFMKLKAPLP